MNYKLLSILPLSTLLFACAIPSADEVATTEQDLVSGRGALESEYPSTVSFGFCTGTKIGPRHFMLAAHCVHDTSANTVQSSMLPGRTISISDDNQSPSFESLTIERTYIHPKWLETCVTPCPVNVLLDGHAPDIAIVVVNQETPHIPAASIDPTPVLPGDRVVLTGYGCENGLGFSSGPSRLKIQEAGAVEKSALLHPGSFVYSDAYAQEIADSYVITPGYDNDPTAASLCPGDSGGPLFRESATELLAVGVNAYYTFDSSPATVSVTNWHTRVDNQTRYDVLGWLQDLGVNIAGNEPEVAPHRVTIEAENYDIGGEHVSYHDADASNNGGAYRKEGVDIEATTDVGGGYNVGWIQAGEWLSFAVRAVPATYRMDLRVASIFSGRTFHVEINGVNVTGSIAVPNTGSWQSWTTLSVPSVTLTTDLSTVRAVFDSGDFNLNWIALEPITVTNPSCTDGAKNGTETDVDCGGSCPVCADGESCNVNSDCQSSSCILGVCKAVPSCTDGAKNGMETDVDCGGSCGACDDGDSCLSDGDCQSATCSAGICTTPSGTCEAPAWTAQSYSTGDLVSAACLASIPGTACYGQVGNTFTWTCINPGWCAVLAPGSNASGWWAAWSKSGECN